MIDVEFCMAAGQSLKKQSRSVARNVDDDDYDDDENDDDDYNDERSVPATFSLSFIYECTSIISSARHHDWHVFFFRSWWKKK